VLLLPAVTVVLLAVHPLVRNDIEALDTGLS
jgi:hypothetical protein